MTEQELGNSYRLKRKRFSGLSYLLYEVISFNDSFTQFLRPAKRQLHNFRNRVGYKLCRIRTALSQYSYDSLNGKASVSKIITIDVQ